MISIIITAFKEPKTIGKAIESFVSQKIDEEYELIVACPDKETHDVIEKYQINYLALPVDPNTGFSTSVEQWNNLE